MGSGELRGSIFFLVFKVSFCFVVLGGGRLLTRVLWTRESGTKGEIRRGSSWGVGFEGVGVEAEEREVVVVVVEWEVERVFEVDIWVVVLVSE